MTLEDLEIPDVTPLLEARAVVVTVTNPEHPFGGVVIKMPSEIPVLVTLNQGSVGGGGPHPITSVFGRTGDIESLFTDYDEFYAPLEAAVPVGGVAGDVILKLGPDDYDIGWGSPLAGIPIEDFARLSLPNVFQQVNFLSGLRLNSKTVTDDYTLLTTDIEVLVDCSVLDIDIALQLPASLGNGQTYHIKKIDLTDHVVSVNVQGFDLIDGAISVNLGEKGADTLLTASAPLYWSIFGPDFSDMLTLPLFLDKLRIAEDGEFLLYNPDMATYHAIRIRGADDDSLYMEIDAGIS